MEEKAPENKNKEKDKKQEKTKKAPTTPIKKAWGFILSVLIIVVCFLLLYHFIAIFGLHFEKAQLPLVFWSIPIVCMILIYFIILATWGRFFAFLFMVLVIVIPLIFDLLLKYQVINGPVVKQIMKAIKNFIAQRTGNS